MDAWRRSLNDRTGSNPTSASRRYLTHFNPRKSFVSQHAGGIQGLQQLLDESASDSRDIRYKLLALGDMLKRQQNFAGPFQLTCHEPKLMATHSKVTNINLGQDRALNDCASTCKARHDSIEHEMRARLKAQFKAGRELDGMTVALQTSRARHAERAVQVKDLEGRLFAAESDLSAALSAQKVAASLLKKAPIAGSADERTASLVPLQIQVNKDQVSKLKTIFEESYNSAAGEDSRGPKIGVDSEIRQQLIDEQRKVQELERQLQGVIKGEDMRPIEFQLHDRELHRKLHAELQDKAAASFTQSMQQVENAASDDKIAMQQALSQALEECRDLRTAMAAQAQAEREREVERNEWQQMLLERHEALQQEANDLHKTEDAPAGAQASKARLLGEHRHKVTRDDDDEDTPTSCDSSDDDTLSETSSKIIRGAKSSRHKKCNRVKSRPAKPSSLRETANAAPGSDLKAELAALRQEVQQMKSTRDSSRRITLMAPSNYGSDSDRSPQQQPPRQAAKLRTQIQQAVAAASRRTTRYSSSGVPGEVVESIDLDQLQQELAAILGQ